MRLTLWAVPFVSLGLAVLLVTPPAAAKQASAPVVVTPNFANATPVPGFDLFPPNPCIGRELVEGNARTEAFWVIVQEAGPNHCHRAESAVLWHWHTAAQRIMMVSGEATLEIKGDKPKTLRSGAFVFLPGHQIHRFDCPMSCEYFEGGSGPIDIHYVGPDGNEISLEQAMAGMKKPAAK